MKRTKYLRQTTTTARALRAEYRLRRNSPCKGEALTAAVLLKLLDLNECGTLSESHASLALLLIDLAASPHWNWGRRLHYYRGLLVLAARLDRRLPRPEHRPA